MVKYILLAATITEASTDSFPMEQQKLAVNAARELIKEKSSCFKELAEQQGSKTPTGIADRVKKAAALL